jgi:tryptophanyl-tRNA synthetase
MPDLSANPNRQKRLLSGMRPTGRLHLGNYVGALENWVRLQHEFASHFFVADWHTLTTDYKHTRMIPENTVEMVTDWLAAGLDPQKSPIFVQSQVKAHAELHLLLTMLITKARLERNPTLKEQVRELALDAGDGGITLGHLMYPVLQAADILMYRGEVVPVGEDQLPHIEIARELARRFNNEFADTHPIFPEPEGLLSDFARLPGLDGNRMSKSVGNTILLSDPPEQIQKRVRTAVTDPQKIRKGDPGRPDVCLVFTYHKKFTPGEIADIRSGCESGALGCVECKQRCAASIIRHLAPLQERRVHFENHPDEVKTIIHDGTDRARRVAAETMDAVHEAMGFG